MPVFKKIAFYIFLAVSLGAAVWAYFNLKESKAPKASVTEHIPASASAVIETKNVHELVQQLTRQNLIWNSLLTEETVANAQNGIQYLDSLTRSSSDVSAILENNPVYYSFVKEGAKNEYLLQFKLKEQKDAKIVEQFFSSVFTKNNSLSSYNLYDVTINQKKWLTTCLDGIVYICSDLSLLQKSIELIKAESLAEHKPYQKLIKLNGNQDTRIYLNHQLSGFLNKNYFSGNTLFNPDIQLNELTCTGYTSPDSGSFFTITGRQKETEFAEFMKLPDHLSSFAGISINDATAFYKETEPMLPPAIVQKNDIAWKGINDSALYNIRQEVYDNTDSELLMANYWLEDAEEQLLQLKIKDEEKMISFLKLISDSAMTVDDEKVFRIRENYSNLFSFYSSVKNMRYGCISSGNLTFFSSRSLLNHYTTSLRNSFVLAKNTGFMSYANDNLFEPSQYLYYENYDLIKHTTFPRLINSVELNTGDDVLSHVSLSIKSYEKNLQVRLHATHKQEESLNTSNKDVLWSFNADSTVNSKVYLFSNHLTQENELCFQDQNNTLYLISAMGKAIWKKDINEPLQSAIYTVDLFKNGKFQLLFNTENYLHLIDRNGNYVQGYPVKMPQRITSPITLLDYDKTKDYRIFIACADKKIYNYSLYGIRTEGFSPVKTEREVKLPVFYAKVGASDYLVAADEGGKLYGFSRKGEGRIDFKNKTIEQLAHLYLLAGNNLDNTKIIYVDDKNNLLNKISLSDKKETFKLGDELNGFHASFDLLNDDKQMDLILYGDGAIHAYDLFSEKLLESFNEQAVYKDARFAYTENSQQIIAFDQAGEKLDMIDLNGKLLRHIPDITQPPLTTELYKDGKIYLITVGHNQINCLRLN